jgi:hypothetical protein
MHQTCTPANPAQHLALHPSSSGGGRGWRLRPTCLIAVLLVSLPGIIPGVGVERGGLASDGPNAAASGRQAAA